VYDRTASRASEIARRLNIPRWFDTEKDFLSQDLDIISICTPPWTHAELACAALERGLHVFTEKPMAMNASEALAMVAAASKAGRLLCVSHNFLFSRAVAKADRILGHNPNLHSGLGIQLSSSKRRLPAWYTRLPGGLLVDESPHMIYTLNHFLGRLELETCRATRNPSDGSLSSVDVQLKGSRCAGHIAMVFGAPISEWHVGLIGQHEVIGLDLFRDITVSIGNDGQHKAVDILRTSMRGVFGHASGFATSGARYLSHRLFWGHDVLIQKFVDSILGGGEAPVDPEEAARVVGITDDILRELALA
jgi:predicted dehydrogenase